jgi:hypothetical protein
MMDAPHIFGFSPAASCINLTSALASARLVGSVMASINAATLNSVGFGFVVRYSNCLSFFEYVGLEFTPLSKPFKTRLQAEKARAKYPERLRKRIGVGVIRMKK